MPLRRRLGMSTILIAMCISASTVAPDEKRFLRLVVVVAVIGSDTHVILI